MSAQLQERVITALRLLSEAGSDPVYKNFEVTNVRGTAIPAEANIKDTRRRIVVSNRSDTLPIIVGDETVADTGGTRIPPGETASFQGSSPLYAMVDELPAFTPGFRDFIDHVTDLGSGIMLGGRWVNAHSEIGKERYEKGGAIWRTADNGETWAPVYEGSRGGPYTANFLDLGGGVVLAQVSEQSGSYQHDSSHSAESLLLKSTDWGQTWTEIQSLYSGAALLDGVLEDGLAKTEEKFIIVLNDVGVRYSTDGGSTLNTGDYTTALPADHSNPSAFSVVEVGSGEILVGVQEQDENGDWCAAFYHSTDDGATWARNGEWTTADGLQSSNPDIGDGGIGRPVSLLNIDGTVYAALNNYGIISSTDKGSTWSLLTETDYFQISEMHRVDQLIYASAFVKQDFRGDPEGLLSGDGKRTVVIDPAAATINARTLEEPPATFTLNGDLLVTRQTQLGRASNYAVAPVTTMEV